MRLMPHPPALLLNKKINSLPFGSLNWSTSFCRFVIVIVPSKRKNPYLPPSTLNKRCARFKGKVVTFCCDKASRKDRGSEYNCWLTLFCRLFGCEFDARTFYECSAKQNWKFEKLYLSKTKNFPLQSQRTVWLRPLSLVLAPAPAKPSGMRSSLPLRSSGRLSNSGWLHSFFRMLMAFNGWEFWPRSSALISGDTINNRYKASWNSDSPQNTTCSYLTGTGTTTRVSNKSRNEKK